MRLSTTILICTLCACLAASTSILGGCSRKAMDREAASDVVTDLPEVRDYMRRLMSALPPATPFARAEAGPEDMEGDYFMVTIGEDHPDHAVAWQRFFVNKGDGSVLVDDIVADGYLTLAEWRKKYVKETKAISE